MSKFAAESPPLNLSPELGEYLSRLEQRIRNALYYGLEVDGDVTVTGDITHTGDEAKSGTVSIDGDVTITSNDSDTTLTLVKGVDSDALQVIGKNGTETASIRQNGATEVTKLIIQDDYPELVIYDTDAGADFAKIRLVNTGDSFLIQTLNSDGGSASTEYKCKKNASGAQNHIWYIQGSEKVRVSGNGNLLVGTSTDGASKLVVNDDSIQISSSKTPSSASDTGTTGQFCWDSNYFYVCIATDTWRRVSHGGGGW